MKRFVELYTHPILGFSFIIGFLYFILGELKSFYFFLGFIAIYILFPFSLLLYIALIFILTKEKNYGILEKRILALFKATIFSFFIFLILVQIGIIHYAFGYAYIYAIFPCVLFFYIISWLIFIRAKQFKILKKSLLKFGLWVLILVAGTFIVNLFDTT